MDGFLLIFSAIFRCFSHMTLIASLDQHASLTACTRLFSSCPKIIQRTGKSAVARAILSGRGTNHYFSKAFICFLSCQNTRERFVSLSCTLLNLHSVLHVPETESGTVGLLHPSFRNFLLDQKRYSNPQISIDEKLVQRAM